MRKTAVFKSVLADDDSLDRACKSIPEEACRHSARNYKANLYNGAASKLAEQTAGPNLVIPWLLQAIGAPVWILGFAMPLKQTFSLLPQMVTAGYIRTLAVRKTVWTISGFIQALCLILMIPSAVYLNPFEAGVAVLFLLIIYSTASGTASVAFQDVLGKTIDKGQRGKLLSARAFAGGVLTIAAGLIISRVRGGSITTLYLLLVAGAVLWIISSLFFQSIKEEPGAVKGGRNAIKEAAAGIYLFKRYKGFRRYLYARLSLNVIEIAVPFYAFYASELLGTSKAGLGLFMMAIGVSQVISSPFWGRAADETSRKVLIQSALISVAASVVAVVCYFLTDQLAVYAGLLAAFVLMGLAEAGVRLGRKTYLVDATPADNKSTFTAFSNSLVGVLSLAAGVLGLIAEKTGAAGIIAVIGVLSLIAVFVSAHMPEADDMLKE
jgi:hypothetical protein